MIPTFVIEHDYEFLFKCSSSMLRVLGPPAEFKSEEDLGKASSVVVCNLFGSGETAYSDRVPGF